MGRFIMCNLSRIPKPSARDSGLSRVLTILRCNRSAIHSWKDHVRYPLYVI